MIYRISLQGSPTVLQGAGQAQQMFLVLALAVPPQRFSRGTSNVISINKATQLSFKTIGGSDRV